MKKNKLVALRKESVDRKAAGVRLGIFLLGSLSARRAWIEKHSPGGNAA